MRTPVFLLCYYFNFGFSIPNKIADTILPAITATKYIKKLLLKNITNIPPCGALSLMLNNIVNAPASADPTIIDGITLNGSPAANGIAPSVINDNHII